MDFKLKGRTALVAGASAGLGAAIAETLVAEGTRVVINSRDLDKLSSCADKIEQATGTRPGMATGDLAEVSERSSVLASATDQLGGRIDILVVNTGGPPPGLFLDLKSTDWDEAGKLLLASAVEMTRAVMPAMVKNNWGRLIYVTSIAVLQPVDTLVLSNSYRAAVTGFCKTISNTYAKHGLTANCVCPGYTATERLENLASNLAKQEGIGADEIMQRFADETAVGRVGQPEELAALVAFLASDRAAYISGCSIPVDGGLYRGLI